MVGDQDDGWANVSFVTGSPGYSQSKGCKTVVVVVVVRDDRMVVASAGPYANHLHLASDSTSSLKFLQAGCSS